MSTEQIPARANGVSAYETIMAKIVDNGNVDQLRELLSVRRDWMADEARGAFNRAVVQFQQECKIIIKGDEAYGGKRYARMDRIWREIRPLMERCGLAVTWESVKPVGDMCVMDGNLRHIAGHAQPLHHEMPYPDKISGQNATQRAGSGETYCKRYATCAALGIHTGEDDDGNGGARETISAEQVAELRSLITAAGSTEAKVCEWARVATLESLPLAKYGQATKTLAARAKGSK